jgi:hypothetical protein
MLVLGLAAVASAETEEEARNATNGSITLLVVDESERPVEQATVHCAWGPYDCACRSLEPSEQAVTDSRGKVVFTGLRRGTHWVRAFLSDRGIWVESSLDPKGGHKTETAKIAVYNSVRGVVKDQEGNPLPGVRLFVRRVLPAGSTDDQGRFEIPNVTRQVQVSLVKEGYGWVELGMIPTREPQECILQRGGALDVAIVDPEGNLIQPDSFSYCSGEHNAGIRGAPDPSGHAATVTLPASQEAWLYAWRETENAWFRAAQSFPIEPGKTTPVILRMELYARVAREGMPGAQKSPTNGRWYVLVNPPETVSVHGKVIMAGTGKPVQANVLCGTSFEWVDDVKARTDKHGAFAVEGLRPGAYYFIASPYDNTLYTLGGLLRLDLSSGKPADGVVFKIEKGCAIRGEVLSADGLPVPGREVLYTPRDPNYYRAFWTNKNGRFLMSHLPFPEQAYRLEVGGTSVEAGPLGKGVISDLVTIRLPDVYLSKEGAASIRGVVIDQNDKPLAGAKIALATPNGRADDNGTATDDQGRFDLPFHEGGTATMQVRIDDRLTRGEAHEYVSLDCPVVEGGALELVQGASVENARMRVAVPELRVLAGTVLDKEGNPLDAGFDVWWGDSQSGTHQVVKGDFIKADTRPDPIMLEFRKKGFQAVVLQSGRDLKAGDRNICVVMKKGPFPEGESVFAAVTGHADTEEGIAAMWHGDHIKGRVAMYEAEARNEDLRYAGFPGKAPGGGAFPVNVTDEKGNPLDAIYVQPAMPISYNCPIELRANIKPSGQRQLLRGQDGRFDLELDNVFISADGRECVVFRAPKEGQAQQPTGIVLHRAARVTVRAVDPKGNPVSGLAVGEAELAIPMAWENYAGLPVTDAKGTATFDQLGPGLYCYSVHRPSTSEEIQSQRSMPAPDAFCPVATFQVEPGKTYEKTVAFGPFEKGSPEALLEEWLETLYAGSGQENQLPAKPGKSVANEIAKLITGTLNELPGQYEWEMRPAAAYGVVAEKLGLTSTVPAIEELLRRWSKDMGHGYVADSGPTALVTALAALAGDGAVNFLADMAGDAGRSYTLRRDSLIALGKIGANKSVKAFVRLRNAAYKKEGVPGPKESYTHAERMAEAAEMVFVYIPGEGPFGDREKGFRADPNWAWVSEDFSTGTIDVQQGYVTYHLSLRRFGEEWLVVGIESAVAV